MEPILTILVVCAVVGGVTLSWPQPPLIPISGIKCFLGDREAIRNIGIVANGQWGLLPISHLTEIFGWWGKNGRGLLRTASIGRDMPGRIAGREFLSLIFFDKKLWAAGGMMYVTVGAIGGASILLVVHTYCEKGGQEVIRIISARAAESHERRAYEEAHKGTEARHSTIATKRDEDIDFSDVPPVLDWSGAEIGKFYRPTKKPVTILRRCIPHGGHQMSLNIAAGLGLSG